MLFNSYIFMFAFLPVVWFAHAAARRFLPSWSNAVLALSSLSFYAWWDLRFVPLILLSIGINFLLGRRIESSMINGAPKWAKGWMVVGITGNLGVLGFFKYADFFLENLATVSGAGITPLGVILPIGISFFTFQQIAYLIDVRQGKSDRYSLVNYALFVSFFPQLIAGPIVHHRDMMPQFFAARGPRAHDVALGLSVFIAGLFKKVVLADNLAPFASPVFAAADMGADVASIEAWGAALAYTFQIYFDFSGYSDMAIGLALLFGIRLPINFNSPYKAGSVIEFWRRWHMTLSQFLRDYLYIPLGGNRKSSARRYVNMFATMLLGGLWHGAGWGFILWGALHGSYLIINHVLRRLTPPVQHRLGRRLLGFGGWALTFLGVVFGWVFFRATTLDGALEISGAMLGIGGFSIPANYATSFGDIVPRMGLSYAHDSVVGLGRWTLIGVPVITAAALLAFALPNTVQIFLSGDAAYKRRYTSLPPPSRFRFLSWGPRPAYACMAVATFALSLIYSSQISEFLYFQF
jgi:D-alanyl-lipoteichoic acid acyltransferase DltB (MBOAT superfamily)